MRERLQKILSEYGVSSRRGAEKLIEAGRVRVNGEPASLGMSADPDTDAVEIDGAPLPARPGYIYLMLNKPRGYVTTLSDEKGRRSVAELVRDCGGRVYPVGRLDMDSEGLLIMTNDGAFAQTAAHPSHEKEKVYMASVTGFSPDRAASLEQPIEIDGRCTLPAKVRILSKRAAEAVIEFRIGEGRNRQIRRLCERAGMRVVRLRRVGFGGLSLGDLRSGEWRKLTGEEIDLLLG